MASYSKNFGANIRIRGAAANSAPEVHKQFILKLSHPYKPDFVYPIRCLFLQKPGSFVQNALVGKLIYQIFIFLYEFGIRLAANWNPKAKQWVKGRQNNPIPRPSTFQSEQPRIWMHCASLGEFEQGRPLLEALKQQHPDALVWLSFFSPSGFEVQKNYAGADAVFYLPMDGRAAANQLLDQLQPSLVLWVKYEYWFHYLKAIQQRKIPLLLISGIFRNKQPFFQWYGKHWRNMLSCFTQLFVQDEPSCQLLQSIHLTQKSQVAGDTRYDRVAAIAGKWTTIPLIENFCNTPNILVAGSTWAADEILLADYVNQHPDIKLILAPHHIDESNLNRILPLFTSIVRYSQAHEAALQSSQVLLIDNVGMLSRLYRYSLITFVGGGFGKDGVHNVLEAAVYGRPVMIGPVYHKYIEAKGLVEAGGALVINNLAEMGQKMDELLTNEKRYSETAVAAEQFVRERTGAVDKIVGYIQEKRLLTN